MTDEPEESMVDEYDYEYESMIPHECPECGGIVYYMGTLGNVNWYRCQDCGMEISSWQNIIYIIQFPAIISPDKFSPLTFPPISGIMQ